MIRFGVLRNVLVTSAVMVMAMSGSAALAGPGPGPGTEIVIRAPAVWNQDVQTSRFMAPILEQPFYAARAVQLPAAVTLHFGRREVHFPAGQILTSVGEASNGVFCSMGHGNWWGGTEYSCLIDADGDGRFEAQQSGSHYWGNHQQLLVITRGHRLTDACLDGDITPLASPLTYVEIDPTRGPAGALQISYELHRPPGPTDGPPAASNEPPDSIGLSAYLGYADSGNQVATVPEFFVLDAEGHGEIDFEGAHFSILGVNRSGRLIYRVTRQMPDQTIHVPPPGVTERIIIPIYIGR